MTFFIYPDDILRLILSTWTSRQKSDSNSHQTINFQATCPYRFVHLLVWKMPLSDGRYFVTVCSCFCMFRKFFHSVCNNAMSNTALISLFDSAIFSTTLLKTCWKTTSYCLWNNFERFSLKLQSLIEAVRKRSLKCAIHGLENHRKWVSLHFPSLSNLSLARIKLKVKLEPFYVFCGLWKTLFSLSSYQL